MSHLKFTHLIHFVVFIYFFLLAVYFTYPLIFNFHTHIPGTVDELYITWILNWDIQTLKNNIFQLFEGNIYYPFSTSLSFSDLHLSSALIAFIPVTFFQEPLMAYTINLFLSFVLLGFFTYALVYFLTSDHASSITAGTVFSFSTYLLPKLGHLQLLSTYWIPLCLLCFFAYVKYRKFRYFALMSLFYFLQFINSFLPAYFLLFLIIALTIYEVRKKPKSLMHFVNRKTIFIVVSIFIFSIPFIYPYFHTSNLYNYTRDIRETIHTANRPEHFFYGFGRSHIAPFFNTLLYKNPGPYLYDGYRGFSSILLTFLVLFYFLFKRFKKAPKYFYFFSLTAIITYVISLGPALQFGGKVIKDPFMVPLPYSILYYLAPGFKGFRNSGRWELFEIFSFCIAASLLISYLFRKNNKTKWTINLILCLVVILEFTYPIKFTVLPARKEIPKVYNFINSTPINSAIVEFPIYNWDMAPYSNDENVRLFYSTFHFRKTINGGGGFSPSPWQDIVIFLAKNFPNDTSISKLKSLRINYFIVHNKEFDRLNNDKFSISETYIPNSKYISNQLLKNQNVRQINTFNGDSVYEILYN